MNGRYRVIPGDQPLCAEHNCTMCGKFCALANANCISFNECGFGLKPLDSR